ncbi:MAG: hypothetical protein AB7I59_25310 [Geminicoccaceae bacterium]
MADGLPAKLLVTQELLGCASRKELCARFRDVNPRTEFDLERSHKWMQGRAKPRSMRVYEDWARLLGTERPPSWLVACTVDAFVDEVCRVFAADPAELRRRVGLDGARAAAAGTAVHYVCGAYAAYSLAWSPYHRGRIVRGSLLIEPGRANRFAASYREDLPSGLVELKGVANLVGRILHLELHEAGSGAPFYVSVFLSGRPASMLSGVASGATLAGPDPQPSSTRIVLIRALDNAAELATSNGYLLLEPVAIATNLGLLGVPPEQAEAGADVLAEFLRHGEPFGLTQVNQAAHARLARLFDAVEGHT